MRAFVMARIKTTEFLGAIRTAKEDVAELPGVDNVYIVSGNFVLIIEVEASNLSGLSRLVDDRVRSVSGAPVNRDINMLEINIECAQRLFST